MTKVNYKSGEDKLGPQRVEALRNLYASPIAANGYVYFTDLEGTTTVLKHGEIPRTAAINRLDESIAASAIVIDDSIILRGRKHLYCIGEK